MRISTNTNFNTIKQTIMQGKQKVEDLQIKAATAKKLNRPSDDPSGSAKVLEMRTDRVKNQQFMDNANQAKAFLNNSDHALEELSEIVNRAKEIALRMSSGANAQDDSRLGVAEEVTQLYQQAVAVANQKVGNRYLFGGYKTDRPPVNPDGNYTGDRGEMMVEIANDVYIAMNIPGIDVFNSRPDASGDYRKLSGNFDQVELQDPDTSNYLSPDATNINVNIFDELQNLRIGLLTGDTQITRSGLDRMDALHDVLVGARSKIGARMNGIDNAHHAMEKTDATNADLTSRIEDADMVTVLNDLAKQETIYRTALKGSEKLIQPTLMDFLR